MTNKSVIDSLKEVLADSYILYLKTQNFHWNVTGPNFHSLHIMFEEEYNDLSAAIDLIAERIRALGAKAPGSFSLYNNLGNISEAGEDLTAEDMLKTLAADQKTIIETLNKCLKAAQSVDDEVTIGIITDRIEIHEKNSWMLNSSL